MLFDTELQDLNPARDGFDLQLSGDRKIHTRTLLLATGVGGIKPRQLPVGHEWYGRGVVYVVTDTDMHSGHDVVVVGGGDSALDWALQLRPVARSVTLVHRRRAFRAHQALLDRAALEGVDILAETEVVAIQGDHRVRRVTLHSADGTEREISAETVVGALGLLSAPTPFPVWGLEVENRRAVVDSNMRTSVPGIFAAGDAATYDGKVPLIVTGFGEAATAVNNAAVHIDPEAQLLPGHSTDEDLAPPGHARDSDGTVSTAGGN